MKVPLSDAIIIAISNLVNDAQGETRKPSHYDIESEINRSGLQNGDPIKQGKTVGKAKRVRSVLNWAIENDYVAGEKLVKRLLDLVRAEGGFREASPNYVGREVICNAIEVFKLEGVALGSDGQLTAMVIDDLPLVEQQQALNAYIRRAQRGAQDAALLVGTSKYLLEAVAAYILQVKWGTYPSTVNFPTLLGQAFTALGLATTNDKKELGESVQKRMERALYETGCAINQLRNKQGTGHGHPFISTISPEDGKVTIEIMGTISEYMMSKL